MKERGVTVEVGGEHGITKRHHCFSKLPETIWEGVFTMAALFEQACEKYKGRPALGTRKFIAKESEITADGRTFEKLTLGSYEWISFEEAFERACNFASGLAALGHAKGERCAIFGETRADWFISLQVIVQ
jgi:long-chain acyl-CoA synthetase